LSRRRRIVAAEQPRQATRSVPTLNTSNSTSSSNTMPSAMRGR
jgi:hypothetical protein